MTLTPACGEKPLPSRSMTRMLQELTLPTIRQGRKDARLTFLYKISQGLVPGIPCENYLIPVVTGREQGWRKLEECA